MLPHPAQHAVAISLEVNTRTQTHHTDTQTHTNRQTSFGVSADLLDEILRNEIKEQKRIQTFFESPRLIVGGKTTGSDAGVGLTGSVAAAKV